MPIVNEILEEHKPVMLEEAINGLNIKPDGIYIDATFGRGGHAELILERLNNFGKLIVIDLDLEAINIAKNLEKFDTRVKAYHDSFSNLKNICQQSNIDRIDGILLDLGVSSPQLQNKDRGFSFMRDGPLDMRMDYTKGITARDWLKIVDKSTLAKIIKQYGQERFANKIAQAIVNYREERTINTTLELVAIIKNIFPKKYFKNKHPATRTFQAIRIFINQELLNLQLVLPEILEILAISGRLVVISFHSLEDTIVKGFINKHSKTALVNNYELRKLPVKSIEKNAIRLKNIAKLKPNQEEIKNNYRSRSAIMRVVEKCA